MRGFLTFLVFISVIFFPWPLTAVLSLASSFLIPFLPLAVGLFSDTLYYTSGLPLFTLCGSLATGAVLFVRSRLKTGSIGR